MRSRWLWTHTPSKSVLSLPLYNLYIVWPLAVPPTLACIQADAERWSVLLRLLFSVSERPLHVRMGTEQFFASRSVAPSRVLILWYDTERHSYEYLCGRLQVLCLLGWLRPCSHLDGVQFYSNENDLAAKC